jgi:hypothetical protein
MERAATMTELLRPTPSPKWSLALGVKVRRTHGEEQPRGLAIELSRVTRLPRTIEELEERLQIG